MQNSQDQDDADSNETGRTSGFGIGQALTAAAATLRAAGTRAQELVEGTTTAVLSSLPLGCIGLELRRTAINISTSTENQYVNNVIALSNTQSRGKISHKGSNVIKSNFTEVKIKEKESGQSAAGQSHKNAFFKGSSIVKTNLQHGQAEKTAKRKENLKAPAVRTPAGLSELPIIHLFKSSSIVETNLQLEQIGTIKQTENAKAPVQTPTGLSKLCNKINFFNGSSKGKTVQIRQNGKETPTLPKDVKEAVQKLSAGQSQSELRNNDFFKVSSIVKTNLQVEQAEKRPKSTESLKAPAVKTPDEPSGIPIIDFSNIVITKVKQDKETFNALPAQTPNMLSELPVNHVFEKCSTYKTTLLVKQDEEAAKRINLKAPADQSELGIQTETATESVGTARPDLESSTTQTYEKKVVARRPIKVAKEEYGRVKQASKNLRLGIFERKDRAPSFITEPRRSNHNKRVDTTFDSERSHANHFGRTDIDFIHRHQSLDLQSSYTNSSTCRIISSISGCRIRSIEPNLPTHKRTASNLHDLPSYHRKTRRLSELVEQRRRLTATANSLRAVALSRTDTTDNYEVTNRPLRALPPRTVPFVLSPRADHMRSRGVDGHRNRTAQNGENKIVKAFKNFFGRCTGHRRRR